VVETRTQKNNILQEKTLRQNPKNAVNGDNAQRNRHINHIAEHGRMNWQKEKGYNQRSQIEAQIGRWKTIIEEACRLENATIRSLKRASLQKQ